MLNSRSSAWQAAVFPAAFEPSIAVSWWSKRIGVASGPKHWKLVRVRRSRNIQRNLQRCVRSRLLLSMCGTHRVAEPESAPRSVTVGQQLLRSRSRWRNGTRSSERRLTRFDRRQGSSVSSTPLSDCPASAASVRTRRGPGIASRWAWALFGMRGTGHRPRRTCRARMAPRSWRRRSALRSPAACALRAGR